MTTPLYRTEAERMAREDAYAADREAIMRAQGYGWTSETDRLTRENFRVAHPVLRPTRAEVVEKRADSLRLLAVRQEKSFAFWHDWLTTFIREYEEATP